MKLENFLARISFTVNAEPSLDCLAELQTHFLRSVPFENLDIMQGKSLDYSAPAAYRKIVEQGRGGVCFENNSLFFWALKEIGFEVKMLEAEMYPGATFRDHFDHMTLLVSVEDSDYIVDGGNGKHFGAPLNIHEPIEVTGENIRYKVLPYGDEDKALYNRIDGEWLPRFAFRLSPKSLPDFADICRFIDSSAESPFTQKLVVTMLGKVGRTTLSGNELTTTYGDGRQQKETLSEAQIEQTLQELFAIPPDSYSLSNL